ncbi:MAG TPA: AAA family ATPase [Gemmatimonadaceae bacterium]|nr:AAA family ATPase [Gemmatimonadaceae bacterium]
MSTLRLRTLGQIGLYDATGETLLLGAGKPLALLTYLCLAPGRRISRDFLLSLLWDDLEPERARRALRQALFHLRRLLGDDALPGTAELAFAADVEVDRDAFLEAIERGELEIALNHYSGEFLPAFGVPGGVDFEHWADLERDRLRNAFLRCSELVVRRQLNEASFRDAQRNARRARQEAPQSEGAWRMLLEAVVSSRDFVAAAVEANALELWASEERVVLDASTRSLLAAARQIAPAASDSADNTLVADLTGREHEFARITCAYDEMCAGGAVHVHVSGRAGFGKTRLLNDVVARIRALGGVVVEASGRSCDQEIASAFAADLALALCSLPGAGGIAPAAASTLIALNPALSSYIAGVADSATGEDALRRRVHAFADLVHAIAEEQPLVLVIDDVHWLDTASMHVLHGLCNRLRGAQVLCVTAARPDCAAPGSEAEVLKLAALSEGEVASFASALGALPADSAWAASLIKGLHAASSGSPLLILETLRLALDEDILALRDGEWHCLDEDRLASLLRAGEALRQRVRSLPPDESWLLGVIATLDAPVNTAALRALPELELVALDECLRRLQQQGLVTHADAGWMPAHDEIATAARETISERSAEANRLAGRLLLHSSSDNLQNMQRGLRHLAASGDEALLRSNFMRYARRAREQDASRGFNEIAREVVASRNVDPHQLVRALPMHWRIGLWSRARQRVAGFIVLLTAVGVASGMYARNGAEAGTQRVVYVDAAGGTSSIEVRASDWDGRTTALFAATSGSALTEAALSFREAAPAVSPDHRSVAWIQQSDDSTTLDVWLRTPAGTRRLTREVRDDLAHQWLSDGSALLGLTNRWSSPTRGGYDVAIFDTATGAARSVTRSAEHEGHPVQSTDGTRIAFLREPIDGVMLVCVTMLDGLSVPECRHPRGSAVAQLLGWSGPTELILVLDNGDARPLVRYDWQRDETTPLFGSYVFHAELSPDRRWVVGGVRLDGIEGVHDWIIPLDRATRARRVDKPADGATRVRWWEGAPDNSQMIHRIEFADTSGRILPGVSTRLAIRALTRAGTQLPLYAPIRWSSGDSRIATIDSSGLVHPHGVGTVTIVASLAGWRQATKRITIVGEPVTVVFREEWNAAWQGRWILFGEPRPTVIDGPDGVRSFWNRGDGNFLSIATQRATFSARAGLGVEIRLSTPLVGGSHLRARVILASGVDTAAFKGANQGIMVPTNPREDASCAATFPSGDGTYFYQRLGVNAGVTPMIMLDSALAKLMTSGAWWTLRLQILPDGRCVFAVNDKVLWTSTQPIPLDEPFRLWLGESSSGTRLLHGPLQMWTGVRTDNLQ